MLRHNRNRLSILAGIAAAAVLGASSGCATPNSLAAMNDQLNQAAEAVNDLRLNVAALQTSIDSLHTVVAKQDTTIGRLANAAGIPVAK